MTRQNILLLLLTIVGGYYLYQNKKQVAAIGSQAYNVGATLMTGRTRGIRNNNPGNIMYNAGITWQGQVGQDAGGYLIFDTPLNGLRAMALDLKNVYLRDGLDTIQAIITRWAPPSSNPTAAYIANVSTWTGIPATTPFNVAQNLEPLVMAIVRDENGTDPYPQSLVAQACSEALAA